MAKLSEGKTVEEPILRYASEAGWTRLDPYDAATWRGGPGGLLLRPVFLDRVQRLNPGVLDATAAEDLARQLERVPPTIEGNLEAWEYLTGRRSVFLPREKRERNVRLMDPSDPSANAFHAAAQQTYDNGTHAIRPDITFFVNGIPVLMLEAKAAHREEAIQEALVQACRYHREGPELMALTQLQTLTNLLSWRYAATWVLSLKYFFEWRDATAPDFETAVKTFLAPRRMLRMLDEFVLFTRRDGELSKVILRPHQMRAVERVIGRARDGARQRGLIWHTQGSGKTYTMIVAAHQLLQDPRLSNPTVLMIVDRNELEAQLFGNLESVGLGRVHVATSKRHLRRLLRHDQRGLIVTTIQKFDGMAADLMRRENVYVLIDEAHRSTSGDLGNYLMGALPNATYLGFTGTPIDRAVYGKGTFKIFGTDDERGYLDKYSIAESIRDGTTVPLHYQLAPSDLQVDRDTLNREFLDLATLEGISDQSVLDRVLQKTATLRTMLKNAERVNQVAAHIAEHYRANVDPMGYKAFIVAVDREACAMYKQALDRHLPADWSEVVYSAAHNDPPELARHHLSAARERAIRRAFRKPDEEPRILIVTDKLLTGYDAPILYCMYLDKPMRDHTLLQAIARVNRPYQDAQGRSKRAGLIYDFVGIFENLEKALAFDSRDVEGIVEGIEELQRSFQRQMAEGRDAYLSLWRGLYGDKAAEAVLSHFRDEDRRREFWEYYRELQALYEILSPAPWLRAYVEDYRDLSAMYQLTRSAYSRTVAVDRTFLRKTEALVREHTITSAIQEPAPEVDLSPEAVRQLALEETSDTVKVFNLTKALQAAVERSLDDAPHLIAIGERAEEIARRFEQRLIEAGQAVAELRKLVLEYEQALASRSNSDLSREGFGVFWLLQNEQVNDADAIARAVEPTFAKYPHWRREQQQRAEVRTALYKPLLRSLKLDRAYALVDRILEVLGKADA